MPMMLILHDDTAHLQCAVTQCSPRLAAPVSDVFFDWMF